MTIFYKLDLEENMVSILMSILMKMLESYEHLSRNIKVWLSLKLNLQLLMTYTLKRNHMKTISTLIRMNMKILIIHEKFKSMIMNMIMEIIIILLGMVTLSQ